MITQHSSPSTCASTLQVNTLAVQGIVASVLPRFRDSWLIARFGNLTGPGRSHCARLVRSSSQQIAAAMVVFHKRKPTQVQRARPSHRYSRGSAGLPSSRFHFDVLRWPVTLLKHLLLTICYTAVLVSACLSVHCCCIQLGSHIRQLFDISSSLLYDSQYDSQPNSSQSEHLLQLCCRTPTSCNSSRQRL